MLVTQHHPCHVGEGHPLGAADLVDRAERSPTAMSARISTSSADAIVWIEATGTRTSPPTTSDWTMPAVSAWNWGERTTVHGTPDAAAAAS